MKYCSKCKNQYSLNDFPKNKSRADGHGSQCKKCNLENVMEWRKRNPEKRKKLGRNTSRSYRDTFSDRVRKNRRKSNVRAGRTVLINGEYYGKTQTLNIKYIRDRLKELRLTQQDAALKIGISGSFLIRLLTVNPKCRVSTTLKFIVFFKCAPEKLILNKPITDEYFGI